MPTFPEDMPEIFDHLTLEPDATSGIPTSRPPIGETLIGTPPENLHSPQRCKLPPLPFPPPRETQNPTKRKIDQKKKTPPTKKKKKKKTILIISSHRFTH